MSFEQLALFWKLNADFICYCKNAPSIINATEFYNKDSAYRATTTPQQKQEQ